MEETLLTVKEVAELTQLHEITIRRYIASGELAAVRVGRRVRVRRDALAQFLKPIYPSNPDQTVEIARETAIPYQMVEKTEGAFSQSPGADPLLGIVGLFDSGIGNLAENHDDHLEKTVGEENLP